MHHEADKNSMNRHLYGQGNTLGAMQLILCRTLRLWLGAKRTDSSHLELCLQFNVCA